MAKDTGPDEAEPLIERATDWLNEKLYPYLGPPDLGPSDPVSTVPESSHPCPICGHPMVEHPVEFDEETGHRFLQHPDDRFTDLMEIG
jgi:hypothetical protein